MISNLALRLVTCKPYGLLQSHEICILVRTEKKQSLDLISRIYENRIQKHYELSSLFCTFLYFRSLQHHGRRVIRPSAAAATVSARVPSRPSVGGTVLHLQQGRAHLTQAEAF